MNRQTFRQAYHAARIGQIDENALESVAAVIALQDRQKPELIGKVYRDARDFAEFIEAKHEKAERLADLRSRRRAKRGAYQVESAPAVVVEQEVYRDEMVDCFNQLFDGRE